MGRILLFALLLSMSLHPGVSLASASFEKTLSEADAVRSAYPKRIEALMTELANSEKQATRSQRERFAYLRAYREGVYRDNLDGGIQIAAQIYEATQDVDLKYRAGSLVANYSAIKRDFRTGLRYLEMTLPLKAKVKNKSIRHDGIGVAAMLYNQIGQYSIGSRYAAEMLKDDPAKRIRCTAGHFEVEAKSALGSLPDSDPYFQKIIESCASIHEHIPANLVRITLARNWAAHGDYGKAVEFLEQNSKSVADTQYPHLIADYHSTLADLKLRLGDTAAAEFHAKKTVEIGDSLVSRTPLVSAYGTLYKIASAREKPTLALELYKRYAESQMAHQSDVKARELAYEIVRHETKQKTKEIELLQAQQRLERENTQKAQLTTLFLAILLAGIVFWAFQVKRHQQQLKKLAQTDSLTGLGNRHFFTQKSERALVEAARAGEPASLVMFDLDHFKAINDTYGHGAGDWVLKQVGKTCSAHCRKIDYIGRIGGEEFAILLRGIDLAGAERLAEECRSQLAKIDTRDCGYSFVVTGSFGVSSSAQSGYDLSRLLSHADQMLYRAKNEGRNRVCAYTAEAAADYRSMRRAPSLSVVNR